MVPATVKWLLQTATRTRSPGPMTAWHRQQMLRSDSAGGLCSRTLRRLALWEIFVYSFSATFMIKKPSTIWCKTSKIKNSETGVLGKQIGTRECCRVTRAQFWSSWLRRLVMSGHEACKPEAPQCVKTKQGFSLHDKCGSWPNASHDCERDRTSQSYYRKRGSASYFVRGWLLWVVVVEREREKHVTSAMSRWNCEWSCIWLPRRHLETLRASTRSEPVDACKDKELGAWAFDRAAGSNDWWLTMGKWKLCARWSACRRSPSSISFACFKQEE